MTFKEFTAWCNERACDGRWAEFEYNGKRCGIEPETSDSNTTYAMWYGETWKDYSDIDDLLSDDFFDGRSLRDIFDSVDVQF